MRLVRSLVRQVGVDLQLIVVVEGSTDGTREALAKCGLPNLEVVHHSQPRGVSAARNAGLSRAEGEYIGFIDDDDFWSPTRVLDAIEAMQSDIRGAAWASCGAAIIEGTMRVFGFQGAPAADMTLDDLRKANFVPGGGSAIVARTEFVRATGGFSSEFADLADWDLWLRLIRLTPLAIVNQYQIAYTFDTRTPSHTNVARSVKELTELRAKHQFGIAGNADVDQGKWNQWIWSQYWRARDRPSMGHLWMSEAKRTRSPMDVGRAVGFRILPVDAQAMIHRMLRRRGMRNLDQVEVDAVHGWLLDVDGKLLTTPR